MDRLRILFGDARSLHQAAFAVALEGEEDFDVIGVVGDGVSFARQALRLRPDVLVVDTAMPVRNGIEACADVKSRWPESRIIVTGDHPDSAALLAAVRAGADGYFTKDRPLSDLTRAIRLVHKGEAVVARGLLGPLLRDLAARERAHEQARELLVRLTRRERVVLELLVEGLDHVKVAERLFISPHTARTHVQNLIQKLGVHSRLEAVALAIEHGLVRPQQSEEAV